MAGSAHGRAKRRTLAPLGGAGAAKLRGGEPVDLPGLPLGEQRVQRPHQLAGVGGLGQATRADL